MFNIWLNNIWYLIITIFHPFNSLDWRQSSLRWYHSLPLDQLTPPVFLTLILMFRILYTHDVHIFMLFLCTFYILQNLQQWQKTQQSVSAGTILFHAISLHFQTVDNLLNVLLKRMQFSNLAILQILHFANLSLMTEYKVAFAKSAGHAYQHLPYPRRIAINLCEL